MGNVSLNLTSIVDSEGWNHWWVHPSKSTMIMIYIFPFEVFLLGEQGNKFLDYLNNCTA